MEIWKDIKGYEGLYQVSNIGRVRNNKNMCLKQHNSCGYMKVILQNCGVVKNYLVHRLVAEAFIPNPDNLSQVNHKDEDKHNNNFENLEWCDAKYNTNYGSCIERRSDKQRNGKRSKPVLQYTLDGTFVKEWASTRECGRNGFHQGHIAECCRGEVKQHAGYIWKYKEVS